VAPHPDLGQQEHGPLAGGLLGTFGQDQVQVPVTGMTETVRQGCVDNAPTLANSDHHGEGLAVGEELHRGRQRRCR
jgi:hypothetical protein